MENDANEVVNLFWTGGWDSTFRLLQLLLLEKKKVQPHYIVDFTRYGTGAEFYAMNRIRNMLLADYPHTEALLLPPKYVDKLAIEPNEEIAAALKVLRETRATGEQYDFMARYVVQHKLQGLEFTIERSIHVEIVDGQLDYWNEDHYQVPYSTDAERTVFGIYSYPVIHLTKVDMQAIAEKNGWMKLMKKTWFCQNPDLKLFPCGKCIPCRTVIAEGLAWRIPWVIKLKNGVERALPAGKR